MNNKGYDMANQRLIGWAKQQKKMAYLRRNYVYNRAIARMNASRHDNIKRVAISMDEERNSLGLTMYKYINHMKSHDTYVRKWKHE